jgi:hypothetical protein
LLYVVHTRKLNCSGTTDSARAKQEINFTGNFILNYWKKTSFNWFASLEKKKSERGLDVILREDEEKKN